MILRLFLFFIGLSLVTPAFPQTSSKALESERKLILRRIKDTKRILERTRRDKYSVLKQVETLRERVRQQQNLL
ncbi:MAG: hypothetical protein AAF740_07560, partial [Bacteroidota bacterium]